MGIWGGVCVWEGGRMKPWLPAVVLEQIHLQPAEQEERLGLFRRCFCSQQYISMTRAACRAPAWGRGGQRPRLWGGKGRGGVCSTAMLVMAHVLLVAPRVGGKRRREYLDGRHASVPHEGRFVTVAESVASRMKVKADWKENSLY